MSTEQTPTIESIMTGLASFNGATQTNTQSMQQSIENGSAFVGVNDEMTNAMQEQTIRQMKLLGLEQEQKEIG